MKNIVGASIKRVRKNQQMTLKTLASQTNFSISFLSQLERGESSATLESLKKVSLALGVNPGYFFQDTAESEEEEFRDVTEAKLMEKHKIHYKSLFDGIEYPAFSPHLVILKPGENNGNLFTHPGQEFLYVLEGQLTVQIEKDAHSLNPSDSIMFDSGLEHYWFNYTNEDVRFLCVNYDR